MKRKLKRQAFKPEFTARHWWLSLQSFLEPDGIFSVRKYRVQVPRFASSEEHFHHLHSLITSDAGELQWTDAVIEATTSDNNKKVVLFLVPFVRKAEAEALVQQIHRLKPKRVLICSVSVTPNSLKMMSTLCSVEVFTPLQCMTKPQLHSAQVPMRLAREQEHLKYTGQCPNIEDLLKFPPICNSDPLIKVHGFKAGSIGTFMRDAVDGPTQEFRVVTS